MTKKQERELEQHERCFKQGERAYAAGKSLHSCLYPPMSTQYDAWQRGWKRARAEYDKSISDYNRLVKLCKERDKKNAEIFKERWNGSDPIVTGQIINGAIMPFYLAGLLARKIELKPHHCEWEPGEPAAVAWSRGWNECNEESNQ